MPIPPGRLIAAHLVLVSLTCVNVRAAVSPTAVTVPLPLPCDVGPAATSRHLSEDAAGRLWVVAHCAGQVVVTTSIDGGANWTPPSQVLPQSVMHVAIEGGTLPGHAVVAWQTFTGEIVVRATDDGAATWSPPVVLMGLASANNGMSLVAEGAHYHVMSFSSTLGQALVRTSTDRGANWNPQVALAMPWAFGDLVHDPGSDALELVSDAPGFWRRSSADHGASFTPAAPLPGGCCLNYSDWAIGGGRILHGVGNQATAWRFDLAASTAEMVGLGDSALPAQRSVDADAAGDGFAATREQFGGRVVVERMRLGLAAADVAVALDMGGDNPNVLACDAGSAAVLWRGPDDQIWFDKLCDDGSWSCCLADTNGAPECRVVAPALVECAGTRTTVALDGGASTDPDLDPLAFAWSSDCPGATFDDAGAVAPVLVLDGAGCDVACSVTLSVSDGAISSACAHVLRIEDTTGPDVAASAAGTACLWPPNHRLIALEAADLAPVIVDACDPAPSWRLVACVSDQPDDGTGDGATEGDCVVAPDGRSVLVRAERDGARPEGRTYALLAVGTDACGNDGVRGMVGSVRVPHDGAGAEACPRR